MKIAVSGAHGTGKTTLVEELSRVLPGHLAVDEPYRLLEEEGHPFAEMPSLEDFELQLERSIESIVESEENRIFDRCPADFLAYMITHRDCGWFDVESWLPRVRHAMEQLDLVIFVPVEDPDRVPDSEPDFAELRRRVDDELREIVLEDRWEFGVETLKVTGSPVERLQQVLARIRAVEP